MERIVEGLRNGAIGRTDQKIGRAADSGLEVDGWTIMPFDFGGGSDMYASTVGAFGGLLLLHDHAVDGQRAEVVIANGSGITVNGGGFINTSRAILTTGTPNFAPDGSLAGFTVTGGNISVQGAGFNAGDLDQVDLLARAVQANAAIYAKNLNVVTGANSITHDTLSATPIAGNGPAPGVSIDVSQLGGMYANRIVLVGTENGVGVSTKGVLAAQAGDLILTAQGKLILAGQTNASGNLALSARNGIDNSGTTYAQQNTTVNAASVVSTGTPGVTSCG